MLTALKEDRPKTAKKLLDELDEILRETQGYGLSEAKAKRFPEGTECRLVDFLGMKSVMWGARGSFALMLGLGALPSAVEGLLPVKKPSWFDKAVVDGSGVLDSGY